MVAGPENEKNRPIDAVFGTLWNKFTVLRVPLSTPLPVSLRFMKPCRDVVFANAIALRELAGIPPALIIPAVALFQTNQIPTVPNGAVAFVATDLRS